MSASGETTYRIDHLVLKVNDLAAASGDFRALGFTVTPGGEHEDSASHNALVVFRDESYLELIAFHGEPGGAAPAGSGPDRRTRWKAAPEGLVDFALLPRRIADEIESAKARGLSMHGPFPGGRLRPDGVRVSWQLGLPDGFDLPFLCADVTDRSLRAPAGSAREHRNGAVGIRRILIGVRDLRSSIERYRALLGAGPRPGTADFELGGAVLSLEGRPGDGPSAVVLDTKLGTVPIFSGEKWGLSLFFGG
jgi:catechol 2,3-dioxygenase-like lactoylglutathione lyase family enzyme